MDWNKSEELVLFLFSPDLSRAVQYNQAIDGGAGSDISMSLFQTSFLFLGKLIRALPKVRGKVALGNYFYDFFGKRNSGTFEVQATLFKDELLFKLNLRCAHERMAYLMGHYEEESVMFLADLWKGGTMLDVGANICLISIPIAAKMKQREPELQTFVQAVESMPSNYQALSENVRLNHLQDAIGTNNIGLGAEDTEVFIQIEGDDSTKTGTANILPSFKDFMKIPLKIRAIDTLIDEGLLPENITLIKIDTDGYDFEIIKGARRLMTSNRPIIFAEMAEHCLNWHGYGIREVVTYLDQINYELWPFVSFEPIPKFTRKIDSNYKINCLLVPQECAADYDSYL